MGAAFGWGLLAASSLVLGAVLALVGLVMAFGSGVLISAVPFDLVQEAAGKASGNGPVTWIDLPTSHWPMWSRPRELAGIIGDVAKAHAAGA